MTLFFITFIVIAIVMAGMSIGVLFGRQSIKGSCGGAGNGACLCTQQCEKKRKTESAA